MFTALDPQYVEPGTAEGSTPTPPAPVVFEPTPLSGPSPALPQGAQGKPVAATPLPFKVPPGATRYVAQYGAQGSAEAVVSGLVEPLSGSVQGSTLTLTPQWAPLTASAVGAGAGQHTVTVFWS